MTLGPESPSRDLAALPVNVWLVGQEGLVRQRQGRYSAASVSQHPGKMPPALARRIITSYTKPGDWILDPMSGIGTTGVEAIHLGRRYVGVELEPRFARLQQANLDRARRQGATGSFAVIQGDARGLEHRLLGEDVAGTPSAPIDAVITSPPYGNRLRDQRNPSRRLRELIRARTFGANVLPRIYGTGPANIGNLPDAAYLQAMRQVYAGCYAVLRPGGLLFTVIRPNRRDGQLHLLHHETARLCCEVGFTPVDEIVAVLSRVTVDTAGQVQLVPHASFFKRLATAHQREAGWPITLEQVEYVLVFRKPSAPVGLSVTRKSGRQAALVGALPGAVH